MNLSSEQVQRYSRQLMLPQWSARFQMALASVAVAVPREYGITALYLAAAGVGRLVVFGDAPTAPEARESERLLCAQNPNCMVTFNPRTIASDTPPDFFRDSTYTIARGSLEAAIDQHEIFGELAGQASLALSTLNHLHSLNLPTQ